MGRLALHICRAQGKNQNERSWPLTIIFPLQALTLLTGTSEVSVSRIRAVEAGDIWTQIFKMWSGRDAEVRSHWPHRFLIPRAVIELWARGSL